MKNAGRVIFIVSMLLAGLSFGAYGVALAAPDLRVGMLGWMVSAGPGRESVHLPVAADLTGTPEATETDVVEESETSETTETPEASEASEFEEAESPEPKETSEVEESQGESENSGQGQSQVESNSENENSTQAEGQNESGDGNSYLNDLSAASIYAWAMAGLRLPS